MDIDYMVHLEDLTLSELEEIMNDEEKINQFVLDDDRLKKMNLDRELILAENRSLADANLGKEPRLLQLKADIGAKYTRLKETHDNFQTNQGKIASLSKEENLDALLAILQTRSAESEEKTEMIAEKFNSKDIDITDFIAEFTKLRKTAHLRRAKVDKMRELILEKRRNEVHNPTLYPSVPKPTPRARNQSAPVQAQPNNPTSYPPYPSYGQHGVPNSTFPSQPPQPYPPAPQNYPAYSW
uniref:vacuolar protein sorting-associated protein 37C-like n=1 Tax=Styela clava TaxID=7725 RepID=UPI00193A6AD3|nr:vacuolar protein sorting-associated protein 37C-like [Styela clava]